VAPASHRAPTFKFGSATGGRFHSRVVADLYAVKGDAGYASAIWTALDEAGVQYWNGGVKILVKVYGGGRRTNQFEIDNPLSRHKNEPITAWLDRVEMDPLTRAIGVEILASELTQAQVKSLFKSCAPCKYDSAGTAKLVGAFTFIAPPSLPSAPIEHTEYAALPVLTVPAGHVEPAFPEDCQHAEYVAPVSVFPIEHTEYVALPVLTVPAGHVEPAFPEDCQHAEYVAPVPVFPIEPIVVDEPIVDDDSVAIVEVADLECRTLRELGLLWKREFGFDAPSKIRKADLITLILAKRGPA
jgi:hypothetical protein